MGLFGFCHYFDAQSVNGTLPLLFCSLTFTFWLFVSYLLSGRNLVNLGDFELTPRMAFLARPSLKTLVTY